MKQSNQSIKPRKVNQRTRVRVVFLAAVLIAAVFLIRLFYLQVWAGKPLREAAYAQRRRAIPVVPTRGSILDRNNQPLAVSVTVNTCYVYPKEVQEESRQETADLYAYILDLDRDEVREIFAGNRDQVILKTKLTQEEVDQLNSSGLNSFHIQQESQRYYPNHEVLAQTLGFVDAEGEGQYGIEASYDSLLRGNAGRNLISRDTYGNIIPIESVERVKSTEGQNVQLTIDLEAQKIIGEELKRGMADFQAEAASAILMDPNTGEILAMESFPSFDPNAPRDPVNGLSQEEWNALDEEQQLNQLFAAWKNPVVSELYEPGSVFKTLTSSISIETGSNKPDSRYICEGRIEVAPGVWIHCWREYDPHGVQTLEEAIANSCNPAFVQIVREIGPDAFYSYLRALNLGGKTGVDLPGETASLIPATVDKMSEIQMATMSYGHGVSMTPMEMIVAANTTINGGYYRKPHLFANATSSKGEVLSTYQVETSDPIFSPQTVKTMREYLLNATEANKAKVMRVEGVEIGSKSGTTLMLENGAYTDKTIASFYSFYPAKNPTYALLVLTRDPKTETFGSLVSGEISARILERLVPLQSGESEPAQSGVVLPDVVGMTAGEARKELAKSGISVTLFGAMSEYSVVNRQTPAVGTVVEKGSTVELRPDAEGTLRMPDVTGKPLDQVRNDLQAAGLTVTITGGTGTVITQRPEAGATMHKDTAVVLLADEKPTSEQPTSEDASAVSPTDNSGGETPPEESTSPEETVPEGIDRGAQNASGEDLPPMQSSEREDAESSGEAENVPESSENTTGEES